MSERDYRAKRRFEETPEPEPSTSGNVDPTAARPGPSFMVHQHHATRLHFDLRLEMMNGDVPVLVSWAVPKNLPQRKGQRHLAIHVEDHPFDYGGFSGTIPAGNYGAGEVRIFDRGTYEVLEQEPAKLTIQLSGERLKGIWHMIRTSGRKGARSGKDEWLVFLRENQRGELDPLPPMEPMVAGFAVQPFDDAGWLFEPQWDGIRALATCTDETLLLSSDVKDITQSYPELGKIHQQLVALEAVVDGTIVAFREDHPATFVASDLIYLDGRSLVEAPIEERKSLLEDAVVKTEQIDVSAHMVGEGTALMAAVEAQGLPSVVAKRLGSPYSSGTSEDWVTLAQGSV